MTDRLGDRFESNRDHLTDVAYRLLGSLGEAEDAVQEAWLRASRADISGIHDLGGWLMTVIAGVCLEVLRARAARREDAPSPSASFEWADPGEEAVLADSVGLALLVALDALEPHERVAFVLRDVFDLPFDEIAPIVDRTPTAARQLASRARRRLRGPDLSHQREVAEAFLVASRAADRHGLERVLDPDVVLRVNGAGTDFRGVSTVAEQAMAYSQRAPYTQTAIIDGAAGLLFAPRGRLAVALIFTIVDQRIARMDVVTDPARLRDITVRPW